MAVALGALLVRVPGIATVGEGVDESYSVRATRAMLAGRFSYADLNDFAIDAYQAKLCPVAEAVAAPSVAVLGDHPLAFRLPSLLASVALVVGIVAYAGRRFGRAAAGVAAGLAIVDYRSVVYAQTHRYVALEQLLVFGVFVLVAGARRRAAGRLLAAAALGVVAIHSHLLAVLALGPIAAACAREDLLGTPRRWGRVVAMGAVGLWGVAMLLVFRSLAIERFGVAPGPAGALASTGRALLGLSPAAAVLALASLAPAFRRGAAASPAGASATTDASDRMLATLVTLGVLAYAALGTVSAVQPRYLLVLQPFVWLLAARTGGRMLARLAHRRALRVAALAAVVLPGALSVGWYLRTRGGRDVERPVVAVLVARAAPTDAVLWDVPRLDPFGVRPTAPRGVPPSHDLMEDPLGFARLAPLGVRYVVRSTSSAASPLWTPAALARLAPIATSSAASSPLDALVGTRETVTLYELRP